MNKALVLHIILPRARGANSLRQEKTKRTEIANLSQAIRLNLIGVETVRLQNISPSHFLHKGACERILLLYKNNPNQPKPNLIIINATLSPIQQRNLEKALQVKILDRTGLILEIFGARAKTREGRLQVALAHLTYQKSRLVRSWTHLERQRGGAGFLGGPGERQIESDRRALQVRITRIKKQLDKVQARRQLNRKPRKQMPFPMVALVGYTNAGKSTLFNRLTKGESIVSNQLFTTLDPKMRLVKMSETKTYKTKQRIILSDTVGFISDLPTFLVSSFRATLEEVIEADMILHVIDVASKDRFAQEQDVLEILEGLRISPNTPIIKVFNKQDMLSEIEQKKIELSEKDCLRKKKKSAPQSAPRACFVSAKTGLGCDELLDLMVCELEKDTELYEIHLPLCRKNSGAAKHFLYQYGRVVLPQNAGQNIRQNRKKSLETSQNIKRQDTRKERARGGEVERKGDIKSQEAGKGDIKSQEQELNETLNAYLTKIAKARFTKTFPDILIRQIN